jgi:mannose-6-phosphate isomerase-like protein (cupin superfamily)
MKAEPGAAAVRQYLLAKQDEGRSPTGSPHLFKAAASDTAGRFDFIVGLFAPLTGPPLHLHRQQDDTFYVLDGVLTVQVDEEVFDIGPGDFLSIPPGVPHTFDNLHHGDDPVQAINLMTPGGHFDMFEEMARVEAGPDQANSTRLIAERYGTVILGPPLRVSLGLGSPPGHREHRASGFDRVNQLTRPHVSCLFQTPADFSLDDCRPPPSAPRPPAAAGRD